MVILLLAWLGGLLTIVSPCILPVLPFVFSRSGNSFTRSGLPLLAGMALTFTLVATVAAVGGGWVVQVSEYGRWLALSLMAVFGAGLLFPSISSRVTRPFVAAGNKIAEGAARTGRPSFVTSFILGVATGLLWTPCAGPILGLILTGAALKGASAGATFLLLAYAAGAATSLMLALLIGGRVFAAMKKYLWAGEWVRKLGGVVILVAVFAIAFGLDKGILTRISAASTDAIEQTLLDKFAVNKKANHPQEQTLVDYGPMPSLAGATRWLNSPPLTPESLKGKVVLVDFWTYSCINCLRTLPYVKAWDEKYRSQGLVVIGVHAPEFAFEHSIDNVTRESKRLGVNWPIAIDNDFNVWEAFNNQYWPALYFIDANGNIRYEYSGEGSYEQSERVIQQLLKNAGAKNINTAISHAQGTGTEQAAGQDHDISSETYLGYMNAGNFASDNETKDSPSEFLLPTYLDLDHWGLQGRWSIGAEKISLDSVNGQISMRFRARDVHLVLGSEQEGKKIRFKVTLDGKEPGNNHGSDVSSGGEGVVTSHRLYQLIRQHGANVEHTVTVEFLDKNVGAYVFTFG